ncbi:hypothetical protein NHQ30_004440 [Ciborinia camelliae]|nr:hypothetical protein NHQ30_004440 [Ciborinia camelliae]
MSHESIATYWLPLPKPLDLHNIVACLVLQMTTISMRIKNWRVLSILEVDVRDADGICSAFNNFVEEHSAPDCSLRPLASQKSTLKMETKVYYFW